jgi:peptidoglycan hydrolase-like protein with peptidoglycan-binding domain
MNQYLKNNPVARSIFENHREETIGNLFENEVVDALLRTICDACLDIYQKITFDVAPGSDRNPNGTREKLSPLVDAKSITNLIAILRNDSAENAVRNPAYADSKNLYLQSLEKYTEALKVSCDINKSNEKFILDYIKACANVKQKQTEYMAKAYKDEMEAKVNDSESYYFGEDIVDVNESGIFTGYRGRVEDLRKILTNLILSSKDKTSKNGYGRDWQTTFVDLDEKRKILDINKGAFGEKDKKALDELEKQVDKYRLEFIKASNIAIDKSLAAVENDEELNGAYGDVNTLCDEAKLLKTRAESQYTTAIVAIKDEHKEKEEVFNKTLFPISKGNTDADDKFKDSGLIFAIQKALCDGIPSAGKLIRSKGGPNGKYGPATKSVIATIQKMEGNKNVNGEIDQALLTDILSSDWVSTANKTAINKALDIAKVKMNDGLSTVFSFSDFVGESNKVNEGKITINNDDFEKELASQYNQTISAEPLSQPKSKSQPKEGEEDGDTDSSGSKSADANKLAEKLRSVYKIDVEGKNFTRPDGSLKPSYNPKFMEAWIKALDGVSTSPGDYGYFFNDGGLYRINRKETSLKSPSNWSKFEKVDEKDDAFLFFKNNASHFKTIGYINGAKKYDALNKFASAISENKLKKFNNISKKIGSILMNKETPFISMENMKGDIKTVFDIALDTNSTNPDMGVYEFVLLNTLLVSVSNCVTYDPDKKKYIPCIKWISDNILTEEVCQGVADDRLLNDDAPDGSLLIFTKDTLINPKRSDIESILNKKNNDGWSNQKELSSLAPLIKLRPGTGMKTAKGIVILNLRRISKTIYPAISNLCKRMNTVEFKDFPQVLPNKCIEIK